MSNIKCSEINAKSTWEEMTLGGTVYEAANSENFKTGDWNLVLHLFANCCNRGSLKARVELHACLI